MQKNKWITFSTLLFLLCSGSASAQLIAVKPTAVTPSIDITVTGSADQQLVDRISRNLQEEAEKLPREDTGESSGDPAGNPPSIVMSQFKKTAEDIPYARGGNPAQRLDIIYPFCGLSPYKTIVNFHGGGWEAGDKRSSTSAAVHWATYQGYAVVNVGYRLSGTAKWPAQLHDAKAAIRFIRANARKYGLDAEKIVVWGSSAGGHLAQMLAATNTNRKMEDLSMGNRRTSSAVQGVVSWYGAADVTSLGALGAPFGDRLMGYAVKGNEQKARAASPIAHVDKDFPPILLVHGADDRVVPFVQSLRMAEKVNGATGRKQARVKLFINGSHGDPKIKSVENVADSLDFVDAILFPGGRNPYRSSHYEPIQVTQ